MTTVKKGFPEIPFAHRVHTHKGHCRFIHGHSWFVEATFDCNARDENNFVYDFGNMRKIKEFLGKFDHALVLASSDPILSNLNGLSGYAQLVEVPFPTCEGLAEYFALEINDIVTEDSDGRAWLRSLTLKEGLVNSATYEL